MTGGGLSQEKVAAKARVLANNLLQVRKSDPDQADVLAASYLTAAVAYLKTTRSGRRVFEILTELADEALNPELGG